MLSNDTFSVVLLFGFLTSFGFLQVLVWLLQEYGDIAAFIFKLFHDFREVWLLAEALCCAINLIVSVSLFSVGSDIIGGGALEITKRAIKMWLHAGSYPTFCVSEFLSGSVWKREMQ